MSDRLIPDDDPAAILRHLSIGVIGYGNQGRAQARNARDAGLDVSIGARSGGGSRPLAEADGFQVRDPARLGDMCDLLAILTPDETHGQVLASLQGGTRVRCVVFAHGFSLRFLDPPLSPAWDVVLVAPSGPGTALRSGGRRGDIPALLAVHHDSSGSARSLARAYAFAAGCARDGIIETTVAEEAEVDLFGEQAVLCGGLAALAVAAWETLVDAGVDPKVAYLECVHQVGLTSEMITRYGIAGMRERISTVALYGDLTRGPRLIDAKTRRTMAEILGEIRTGRFAAEWSKDRESNSARLERLLAEAREHPVEDAGRSVRDLFGRGDRSAGESPQA